MNTAPLLDITGKIDCPQCKTAGVLDVSHPSGNPALETTRTCDNCGGDGFVPQPTAVSVNPYRSLLVDGRLKQCNGALPMPRYLSVTQARDVCADFELDFEDVGDDVQVLPAPVNGGLGVLTAELASWIASVGVPA